MAHKGGKGYPKTAQIRVERHDQAVAIAEESGYSNLTTEEKLKRVLAFVAVPGNGEAKKQIAKLQLQLKKEEEARLANLQAKVKVVEKPSTKMVEESNSDTESAYNKKSRKYRK